MDLIEHTVSIMRLNVVEAKALLASVIVVLLELTVKAKICHGLLTYLYTKQSLFLVF